MSRFNWAPTAYRMLDGLFCIFKSSGTSVSHAVQSIRTNLAKDLNALPCYQHEIPLRQTSLKENIDVSTLSPHIEPTSIQDWSEHRLVLGDRYEESDFRIRFVDGISTHTSGVIVMGIGRLGRESTEVIASSKFLRVYHAKGRLGWATDDFTPRGRILERTSFRHVTRSKLDKVCAAAQAAHTRQMYSLQGVNPDSQEAYEMAAKGIIRPASRKSEPVLYGIKCIDFQPPDFTLEIHCINETSRYLESLIHNLGIKLKTTAVCSGLRRLRYGHFDVRRALLRQHWHLDHIIDNIEDNMELLTPEKLFVGTEAQETNLLPPGHKMGYLSQKQQLLTDADQLDLHDKLPSQTYSDSIQNAVETDIEYSDSDGDSDLNSDNSGVK